MSTYFAKIETLLREISEHGTFQLTSLADADGFSLVTIHAADHDPDIYAAVAARIQRTAKQTQAHLDMGEMDEVSIYYKDGQRLVSRPFQAHGQDLILSVLVPKKRRYRRLTNRAISIIRREWKL